MNTIVYFKNLESPLGNMIAGAVDEGVCLLEFRDREDLDRVKNKVAQHFNAQVSEADHVHLLQLEQELKEYFDSKRKDFSVPLAMSGTGFQNQVWAELLKIPFGKTRTYKEQALALKNLEGIRAVASANGKNIIAIVVPCHRVIGSNGDLTGYAGGLWRKKWLLEHESESAQLNLF